jgi:hypothetical protein
MPSPFPGIDPYLEHPAIFPGFHDRFVTYLSEALQPVLPAPYYADIGDRVWVEVSERHIGPDVKVLLDEESDEAFDPSFASPGGVVGVATEVQVEPVVITVPHDEFREPYLEIRALVEGERLVTAIEVLSLTNKTPGAHGRDLYVRKQREVLQREAHLVEIDLLRGGEHSTAVPLRPLRRARKKTGPFDYHVCIHRFDNLEDYFIYPIRLENRLPTIAIPLLPGDGDVKVDLQAVFNRCYDTGPYRRRIEYGAVQPQPPLSEERWAWTKRLLTEKRG